MMEPTGSKGRPRTLLAAAAALVLSLAAAGVTTAEEASYLPPTWHIHDGQGATLGPQHKAIGFFPTILGISAADYLLDPARCPNATDKAFLPSFGSSEGPLLRAGVCVTSSVVISLRTVPTGTSGPEGWASITVASEPGWVTYYQVTAL